MLDKDIRWISARGYEGLYEVSSTFRVRNVDPNFTSLNPSEGSDTSYALIRSHRDPDSGQSYVLLKKDGKYHKEYVEPLWLDSLLEVK